MTQIDSFREEVKQWLDDNCPASMRAGADPETPLDEVWGGRKGETQTGNQQHNTKRKEDK